MTSLVEAMDDEQAAIRRLGISALGTIGGTDMVIAAMSRQNDSPARRAAIDVLRSFAARGPESAKELRTQLEQADGAESAAIIDKLLAGYSAKEAGEEATYTNLVKYLKHPDVGVRELALGNLEALTGRDNLQYDPDQPEGAGLAAWQDLLKRKELPPKPAAKKAQ
jgi:HEAT repeat protein